MVSNVCHKQLESGKQEFFLCGCQATINVMYWLVTELFQVVVEMEMRKESELGGFNEEGHVMTHEERRMMEEDKELLEDSASAEGIKDEDFMETREKVKDLRRLLNDIQSMQQKERRRLTGHAETNEHSHSSMVLNSLMETLLFMAVTGYQVYTIRKWFTGAPVLGR